MPRLSSLLKKKKTETEDSFGCEGGGIPAFFILNEEWREIKKKKRGKSILEYVMHFKGVGLYRGGDEAHTAGHI